MERISQRIQAALISKGKKQKDLADYLGKSESALSRMLAGETFKPDIMIKISQFLGVDLNFFNRDTVLKSVKHDQHDLDKNDNDQVEYLKQIIATKDEVIKSKDDLIATLREKLKDP